MSDEEIIKRRYREYLDLMPLTLAIAGLPPSAGPMTYNEDQMGVRTQALAAAFKFARQAARDAVRAG